VRSATTPALLLLLSLCFSALVTTAAPAEAAYRYWSYWRRAPGASGWTYSTTGPSYRVPDGAVEGWRFQDYGSANPSDPPPRSAASFAQICAKVAPADGMKRVGITVDFGAQGGVASYCVRVATSATGDEALAQRARELSRPAPRYNSSGLLCAIDGRPPAPECGRQVESPKPATASSRPTPARTTRPPAASAGASASATVPPSPAGTRSTAAPASQPSSTAVTTPPASTRAAAATATPSGDESPSTVADPGLVLDTPTSGGSGGDSGLPVATLVGAGMVAALGSAAALRMRSRP
jgi:hypothetical protein